MIFSGETLSISKNDHGTAHLVFDRKSGSVNVFDRTTVAELASGLDRLEAESDISGLLISSAMNVFVVGADISEFVSVFKQSEDSVASFLTANSDNLRRLERLDYPVVAAINGFALGGGLELCLSCDMRVASDKAAVGFAETGLGLIPGWGGTARTPRITSLQTALDWVVSGKQNKAQVALDAGVIDFLVSADDLLAKANAVMADCQSGILDYRAMRNEKESTRADILAEASQISGQWLQTVEQKYGDNMPAQRIAVQAILDGLDKPLDEAILIERQGFVDASQTDQAKALVGNFLSDQFLMKQAKARAKTIAQPISKAGVLGAGIMGGGIAFQSALTGTPAVMKDIAQGGLDLGMGEADKLLSNLVKRGRMNDDKKAAVLSSINPTLDYDENFESVDILVEAVVENIKVKHAVLTEVENKVDSSTVICSNTSTLPISDLAIPLIRPELFCGMHFFNPVHAMPLVEVIRGEKTSEETINKTVAYALSLKKKPVVVNDCPGFLVNRILFAYYAGFLKLLNDGADYEVVDGVMEKWGWPMGPAYLADVIGLDTMKHCEDVITAAYVDRQGNECPGLYEAIVEMGGLGQKNGKGFYTYTRVDGRPSKSVNQEVKNKLAEIYQPVKTFSEEEIFDRLMLAMGIEAALAIENNIVESPEETDISLLYGLGFPAFRGGIMRMMDAMGMKAFVSKADKYQTELGALYKVTDRQREMATNNESYYG